MKKPTISLGSVAGLNEVLQMNNVTLNGVEQNSNHQWHQYEAAKKERRSMQQAGVSFTETYEQFISRITRELGL